MTRPSQRLASPDILKAIAILAVPVIHAVYVIPFKPSLFDQKISPDLIYWMSTVYRFCVPAFIFLFAYFQEKSLMRYGKLNRIKRFYKLLLPFIFWSAIYFLLSADFSNLGPVKVITKHWSGYGWSGQYYFVIIFQLIFLFPLISRLLSQFKPSLVLVYGGSLIFLGFCAYSGWYKIDVVSKIGNRPFVYWLPYVVLGILYAKSVKPKFSVPILIGIAGLLLIPLEIAFLNPDNTTGVEFPAAFVGIMLLIHSILGSDFTYDGMNSFIQKIVNLLATHSLGIFCLNPLVIFMLRPLFHNLGFYLEFPAGAIIVPILSGLIVTGLCLLIIYLLKRMRLGFLVAN